MYMQTAMQEQKAHSEVKDILAKMPAYAVRPSMKEYHKQLVESRNIMYHAQSLRMISKDELADPEAKRNYVIKKVARELWTNFCVRGQSTPSLDYLHEKLRKEYGEDLEFEYRPGSIELMILRIVDGKLQPVDRIQQLEIINKAWIFSQEVVSSYTM